MLKSIFYTVMFCTSLFATTSKPSTPLNIKASQALYSNAIEITFTSSSKATYYELYRHSKHTQTKKLVTIKKRVYLDRDVNNSISYIYSLKACNTAGCSDMSSLTQGHIHNTNSKEHSQKVDTENILIGIGYTIYGIFYIAAHIFSAMASGE